MADPAQGEHVVCSVHFGLAGQDIEFRPRIAAGPVRVADLLPALGAFTDIVAGVAVAQAEREGKSVSCRKGCGACCRQPVPVGEAEAIALWELVKAMSPERQAVVRSRFRDGIERLAAAGLLEAVRALPRMADADAQRQVGVVYFRQQIPCPFLEDESCSIHVHRPLSCREYLVTSRAAHCSTPERTKVARLDLPGKPSYTLYRFGEVGGTMRRGVPAPPRWVPLIVALEWAEQHPRAGERRLPGPRLLEAFLRRLAGQ